MADKKTAIKNFYGQVIGYVIEDGKGNKRVTDFYNRILGYYDKDRDVTTDFYRRVVAKGDASTALLNLSVDNKKI